MSELQSSGWKSCLKPAKAAEQKPVKHIVKREGETEEYDSRHILAAIEKAILATRNGEDRGLAVRVLKRVEEMITDLMKGRHPSSVPHVEELQDLVEHALAVEGAFDVAKSYILYRSRHADIRDARLMIDADATMDGYLDRSDWRVNENANVNFSLGGLILHNSGTITANYWLKNVYSEAVAEAHRSCAFHIHDLSMFSGYCAGWSIRQVIEEGLGGVPDKISSAPAGHLSTLVNQLVNFLGIMQNEWAGAQAFSGFDTYLAPFVKEDKLEYKAVKQCVQSFIFGVNTPSRWGSQAPFTNITLDWTVPEDLREKKAIVGGKELDYTYGDCKPEMDLVNRAFLEIMIEGDANGRGFAYPIPTYNVTKDFDWDTENAKLLFDMTGKYGTPYFQNFINSDLDPRDVRSMCCRLQLDKRELRKRGGGLFGSDEFTGSVGVVTLNLPQIAYLTKKENGDKAVFFKKLAHMMDLAAESLTMKRKVVNRLLEAGLFPYTKRYLKHMNNHFSTIGICGMNECTLNLMDKTLLDDEGRDFALEVLQFMRDRMAQYQEETGDLFNLEASPAESTSYRLALHDKKSFPDIITAGDEEGYYYTNSSQLPVMATADIFEALDRQDALQSKYTGGTVFHGFLGESIKDWRVTRDLVKTIAYRYHLPYFTMSPTFSVCQKHGYLAGENFNCPKCRDEKRAELAKEIEKVKEELAGRSA